MTISANYPSIRPSLLLDFANTEQLDPRITFSRPTTGTYYNGYSSAVAEQNLILYSQLMTNGAWTQSLINITANTVTAPDGTTTGNTLTDSVATNARYGSYQTITTANGLPYTYSFYIKAGTKTFASVSLSVSSTSWCAAKFDLSAGTVGSTDATSGNTATATITSAGSSWYRCTVTGTFTTGGSTIAFICLATDGTTYSPANRGNQLYTGDGTGTIYAWGAQLEQRSAVTAYNATTTTTITNYIPVLQTGAINQARFDHNPTTGESLGLLIEQQSSNLLTYSDDFSNAAYTKFNSTINSNTIVAPDGTLNGDKIVENTANSLHGWYYTITLSNTTTYTWSAYLKAGERSWAIIDAHIGTGAKYTWFNLANGTVGTNEAGGTATITAVGNGWYRCSVSRVTAGTNCYMEVFATTGDNITSYTGNGYSGIFCWGAQLEALAFPTSYIPTVASQVTRSADSASMTGTNFSSWYNQAEGTIYTESATNAPIPNTTQQDICEIASTSTRNDRIELARVNLSSVAKYDFVVTIGGVAQCDLYATGYQTTNTFYKVIGAYKQNNFSATSNGGTVLTDTTGNVPSGMGILTIGATTTNGAPLNGTIKKLSYYPIALTSANLIALTGS